MKELLSVKLGVEDDGERVIEISEDSPSTELLDEMIAALGRARATLKPSVPVTVEPLLLTTLPIVPDPGFSAALLNKVGPMLLVRHPGFGWMALQMDQQRLEKLAALVAQVQSDLSQGRVGLLH